MFSGGVMSWACAKRVATVNGLKDLTLLFTDTLIEDPDLYRFLDEAAKDVFGGAEPQLIKIAEGRTPWQVFHDEKLLGNTQKDICSRILKRELGDRWLRENCEPGATTVYLGIDWTEKHRFDDGEGHGAKNRYMRNGWDCAAPLCDPPFRWKRDYYQDLADVGIKLPYLYGLGFGHNNCGGFCIKAGMGHFQMVLERLPDRYRQFEAEEEALRTFLGKNVAVLRDRSGKRTRPLPLREFRERLEAGSINADPFDLGGCGCFL